MVPARRRRSGSSTIPSGKSLDASAFPRLRTLTNYGVISVQNSASFGALPAAVGLCEPSLTVPDGDGVPSRVSTPAKTPCLIPAGESRTVELYVRFGRVRSRLDVEFQAEEGSVRRSFEAADRPDKDQFPAAVENHRKLVVTVAMGPIGVEEAFNLLRLPPKDQAVVGRVEDASPVAEPVVRLRRDRRPGVGHESDQALRGPEA